MTKIYEVTHEVYWDCMPPKFFSTREKAEAYISKEREHDAEFAEKLFINEHVVDKEEEA